MEASPSRLAGVVDLDVVWSTEYFQVCNGDAVMRRAIGVLIAASFLASARAVETWDFRGAFVTLDSGETPSAIFQLPDGTSLKIPLAALGPASRREVKRLSDADKPGPDGSDGASRVSVRGSSGKPITLPVPAALKEVETKAFFGRTAKDAVAEYQKFVDRDDLPPATRQAAEERLTHWKSLANEGRVRVGDEWITEDEKRDRERKAADMVSHAVELLRLGNGSLAREELRNASRMNPESGKADFLAGLLYVLVARNDAKGVEHFEEVVRREPRNAYAMNNLAVCQVMSKQSNLALGHFRKALEIMPEAQAVADNLGSMIRVAGAGRLRISAKVLGECNSLYRSAISEHGLQPLSGDRTDGFTLLGEDGTVWDRMTASTLIRPAGQDDGSGAPAASGEGTGIPGEPASPGESAPAFGGIDFQAVIQAAQAVLPGGQQPAASPEGP